MNKEEIKGEVGKEIVEDSCGCVFCDLDLEPESHISTGEKYHPTKRGDVPCTKPR